MKDGEFESNFGCDGDRKKEKKNNPLKNNIYSTTQFFFLYKESYGPGRPCAVSGSGSVALLRDI